MKLTDPAILEVTSVAGSDFLYTVVNPGSAPASRKIQVTNLLSSLLSLGTSSVTMSSGMNSDINPGSAGFLLLRSSVAFSIGGFTGGTSNKLLWVFNADKHTCTIAHEDTSSQPANRIQNIGDTNEPLIVDTRGSVIFIYSALYSRWITVAINGRTQFPGLVLLGLKDASWASTIRGYDLLLAANSSVQLSAQRTLTFDVVNANRTLKLTADATISGTLDARKDGIGATSTDGVVLQNNTAAAVGAQQWSPRLHLIGQGWKTNAAAASQTVDWILENQPIQGTANPTSNLVISSQVNAAGYNPRVVFTSDGSVVIGTTAPTGVNERLSVYTGAAGYLAKFLGAGDSFFIYSDVGSSNYEIGTSGNGSIFFDTNLAVRAVLDSAGRFGLGTISPSDKFEVAGAARINGSASTNGEVLQIESASELLTLSTTGATTDTTANLLPAGAIILAVDTRVTTTITTATSFSVGDATTATRFANALTGVAAGSTNVGIAHLNSSLINQTAAAKVRITCNATPGAGVVRITVHYIKFTAPTS